MYVLYVDFEKAYGKIEKELGMELQTGMEVSGNKTEHE